MSWELFTDANNNMEVRMTADQEPEHVRKWCADSNVDNYGLWVIGFLQANSWNVFDVFKINDVKI